MNIPVVDILSILPVVVLSVFGIAIMVLEPFLSAKSRANSTALGWLAFAGTLAAALAIVPMHSIRDSRIRTCGSWTDSARSSMSSLSSSRR